MVDVAPTLGTVEVHVEMSGEDGTDSDPGILLFILVVVDCLSIVGHGLEKAGGGGGEGK